MQTLTPEPAPVKIHLKLHPAQQQVFNSQKRFNVVICGRRFGKTHLEWVKMLTRMISKPNGLYWWVVPFYKELAPVSRKVNELTPPQIIAPHGKTETQGIIRRLKLFNGSECWFHSADKEDSLRGSGLNGMVIDEAAKLKENRWSGELEMALADFDGWCDFIGTPKGKNWLYKQYCKGLDPLNPLYAAFSFSSYENTFEKGGFLSKSSIDTLCEDMPDFLQKQEVLGAFLEGEGEVFRNLTRQIRADITQAGTTPCSYEPHVYIGLDVAKTVDYTVLIAVDDNGQLVGFDRFNKLDWDFIKQRIITFCSKFHYYRLLIDSTGVGSPIHDDLVRLGINVHPYQFTATTKKDLIDNLSHLIDTGEVWFPGDPKNGTFAPEYRVLQTELEQFTYEIGDTGNIRYGAPEGENFHDDAVIACALAVWSLAHHGAPPGVGVALPASTRVWGEHDDFMRSLRDMGRGGF